MVYCSTDIESDGPCPGLYSMISFGIVVVEPGLSRTFYAELKPLPDASYLPDALRVSGFTREQTEGFREPLEVMKEFDEWVRGLGDRAMFVSDNNGFDWQFINWYFWKFVGSNPFGHSSTNLGSLYKGIVRDTRKNFKHLRKTKHTHNALQDAIGNAEAMLHMMQSMRLK